MNQSFDNISEASATNYLFGVTQRTLALQNEPPTPPPLNALGLPCHAIRAMLELPGWLRRRAAAKETKETEEEYRLRYTEEDQVTEEENQVHGKITGQAPTTKKALDRKRSAVYSVKAAKKIAPHAKKITEYIQDHQDDAAQEERWRTTMKRDMGKSFRKVKEEMQSMQKRSEQLHSKVDKKLDRIVKDLGRLTAV